MVGADLLSVEGDAIVSPADNRLSGLYGLAKTIRDAAGEELTRACRAISIEQRKLNLPPCPPMTTVVTPAFGLADRYKHILHTVGPIAAVRTRTVIEGRCSPRHTNPCSMRYVTSMV